MFNIHQGMQLCWDDNTRVQKNSIMYGHASVGDATPGKDGSSRKLLLVMFQKLQENCFYTL